MAAPRNRPPDFTASAVVRFLFRHSTAFQHYEFMCSQYHVERTSSGLRRSLCFGSSISVDGFYLFSLFKNDSLQTHSSVASQDAHWTSRISRPPFQNRLATGVPGSDSGMEEERCGTWTERMDRSRSDRFGCCSRIAQFGVMNSYFRRVGEVSLKTSLGLFFVCCATRLLSP